MGSIAKVVSAMRSVPAIGRAPILRAIGRISHSRLRGLGLDVRPHRNENSAEDDGDAGDNPYRDQHPLRHGALLRAPAGEFQVIALAPFRKGGELHDLWAAEVLVSVKLTVPSVGTFSSVNLANAGMPCAQGARVTQFDDARSVDAIRNARSRAGRWKPPSL